MRKDRFLLAAALGCVLLTGCAAQPAEGSGSAAEEAAGQPAIVDNIAPEAFAAFGGCASLRLPGRLAAAAATGSSYQETSAFTSFSGSSADAWQRLLTGELDVVLAYAPDGETAQRLETQGISMQAIGTDALVLLAGGTQQSPSLTKAQLAAAYQAGGAGGWKGYASAPGSASRELFAAVFGTDSAGVTVQEGGDTLTAACPHTAGTLCYTTYLSLPESVRPVNTAPVAVDGMLPDARTLAVDADTPYPLRVSYYAACRGGLDENDPGMLFYRWLTSEDAMRWLAQAGDATQSAEGDAAN